MTRLQATVVAALVTLGGASAQAQPLTFTAILTNGQENPPTVPTTVAGAPRTSFGFATFVLNAERTSMTFTATITGLDFTGSQSTDVNDNLVAAHIHAGPAVPPANNPVVWGFFGQPFNDNAPNDVVTTPFVNTVGGTISGKWDAAEGNNTTLLLQLPNILEGRSYINFHTTQFPGGEIRGAIVVTPEPGAWALLATGLTGVGLLARRRRVS